MDYSSKTKRYNHGYNVRDFLRLIGTVYIPVSTAVSEYPARVQLYPGVPRGARVVHMYSTSGLAQAGVVHA